MFYSPWLLLLLLWIPIVAWRYFWKNNRFSLRFSTVEPLLRMSPTIRQRLLWLPQALTILAIACLIVAIARPREGVQQTVVQSEGIAIQLVVDRSGSMQALDFKIDGQRVDRMTAIKSVAGKFVAGGDDLSGRYNDLVGLISFARYADGLTPLTLDHGFLLSKLNNTEIVNSRGEDGTAIGDAIALAVEKLNALDDRQGEAVKSKVIILLTDGENNVGAVEPLQAAELAQTMGIKIYTIGIGTIGDAPMPVLDPFTGNQVLQMVPVTIDDQTLTAVAEMTGGKYFRATDTDSLENIYAEIDSLEKTKVESQSFVDYRELAVQGYTRGSLTLPPVLMLAFVLLAGRWLLQETWLRTLD